MNKRGLMVLAAALLVIVFLVSPTVAPEQQSYAGPASAEVSVLSGEFQISQPTSPECMRTTPQVVYNGAQGEYLVTWENWWGGGFHDIYAQRVGRGGELKSHFTVATGADGDGKARLQPALAYNAADREYLFVYMVDTPIFQYEIRGRRVAWNGSWHGDEFTIFSWPNRSFWLPRVVWNSTHNEYLVVASAFDTQSRNWNDVAGRRVMADGSMPFAGHSISTQDQATQPNQADVAYNPTSDEYLVVWQQRSAGNYREQDIWGARVRGADAAVLTPLLVDVSPGDQTSPAVAADKEGSYLVVWEHAESLKPSVMQIYGRELGIDGGWRGERFPITISTDGGYNPAIVINETTNARFVTWAQSRGSEVDIWGMSWEPSPSWIGNLWLPSRLATKAVLAAVAAGAPGYLVVYREFQRGGLYHIYGRIYWPQAVYVPLAVADS